MYTKALHINEKTHKALKKYSVKKEVPMYLLMQLAIEKYIKENP